MVVHVAEEGTVGEEKGRKDKRSSGTKQLEGHTTEKRVMGGKTVRRLGVSNPCI